MRVWIIPGCTSCGLCESISPEVFSVEDEAVVNLGVNYDEYKDQIIEAADSCPAAVIEYDENI
jgi:ferredoxin